MIKVIKNPVNESVDEMENEVTPVTSAIGTPVDTMQDIPANATDAEGKIPEEGDFDAYKEREVDYTNPKYQKIIDYLNDNGYPGSKFLGKMGFYIPQHTSYVSIIFDDIFVECSIMTTRFRLSPSGASDYMSELAQVIPVVDAINAILADATTDETKDRHVTESIDKDTGLETEVITATTTAIDESGKISTTQQEYTQINDPDLAFINQASTTDSTSGGQ